MIPAETQAVIDETSRKTVQEFIAQHPCFLSENERGYVKALVVSIEEAGGNHDTVTTLTKLGVGIQKATQKSVQGIFLVLLIGLVFFVGRIGFQRVLEWLK